MNLYFRLFWTYLRAMLKPGIDPGDMVEMDMRVWPNDLDVNRHMNNGRFMTVLDLGIIESLVRSRFFKVVRSLGGFPMEGGTLITYRKQLSPFQKYKLRMWYLGCDRFWHVFSFVFMTADGKVAARGLLKGGAVKRGTGLIPSDQIWGQYETLFGEKVTPPPLPEVARRWLQLEADVYAAEHDLQPAPGLVDADNAVTATPAKPVYAPDAA